MIDTSKIAAALAECLERCEDGSQPSVEIPTFLHELKTIRGWTDSELEALKKEILREVYSIGND